MAYFKDWNNNSELLDLYKKYIFYCASLRTWLFLCKCLINSSFTLLKLQTVQEPSHYNTREFVSEITAKPSNKNIYRTQIKKSPLVSNIQYEMLSFLDDLSLQKFIAEVMAAVHPMLTTQTESQKQDALSPPCRVWDATHPSVGAELHGVDQSEVRHINLSWHTGSLNGVHLKGWDAIQNSARIMKLDWQQRVVVCVRISAVSQIWGTSFRKSGLNLDCNQSLQFLKVWVWFMEWIM